ncbi:putative major capsid protein [uncultured Mediterranean phage uvMED]|nr:putative major capsid protein [uncultured Mediterranean phage uvMED]
MSNQITTSMVKQFSDTLTMVAQQEGSRLRNAVQVEAGKVGEEYFMDRIGKVTAQKVTSRHADSPLIETPHERRRITPVDYNWGDLVDSYDMLRVIISDPASAYMTTGGMALGRAIDEEILEAAYGTAYLGKDGSTSALWDTGDSEVGSDVNIVAVNNATHGDTADGTNNSGLTLGKLIEARGRLMKNEVIRYNEGGVSDLFIVCTADQIENLLATTEVQSSDYNMIRALVEGQVHHFMGFNFIQTELVPNKVLATVNSETPTVDRVLCFQRNALGLCLWKDIAGRITERADKRFSLYTFAEMTIGATRLDEKRMVEIHCKQNA